MSICTACLRPTDGAAENGRPWCKWCGDYADRYAQRMPDTLDLVLAVRVEDDAQQRCCLTLTGDILGTWSWPAATVRLLNRSVCPVVLHYPTTPCECLEMIVRDCRGERLSRRPAAGQRPIGVRTLNALHTEVPSEGQLQVRIDPMAGVSVDAIRAGEYTVQAVFRNEGWQAVSEAVPIRVTSLQLLSTGFRPGMPSG
jgi:hypothetical protein